MTVSSYHGTVRQTLVGAQMTGIAPPLHAFSHVSVNNQTGADLEIHTCDDRAQAQFRVLAPGFERSYEARKRQGYRTEDTALWLYSAAGGLVVLEWSV